MFLTLSHTFLLQSIAAAADNPLSRRPRNLTFAEHAARGGWRFRADRQTVGQPRAGREGAFPAGRPRVTTIAGPHISQLYVAHCHSLPASQSARLARLAARDTDGRRGSAGAHPREEPCTWKKHYIFRVSAVKLRDLHLWSLFFFLAFCYVGGLRKPCSMVNSLR